MFTITKPKKRRNPPKPTPGPYRAESGDVLSKSRTICRCGQVPNYPTDKDVANAEFIARACNSHHALIEALEGVINSDTDQAWLAAKDAIKKAKGE